MRSKSQFKIRKRKVLEFLGKLDSTIANSFASWYMDALKDVEGRAQAVIDTTDDATSTASASPSIMSTNFCPESSLRLSPLLCLKRAVEVLGRGGREWSWRDYSVLCIPVSYE